MMIKLNQTRKSQTGVFILLGLFIIVSLDSYSQPINNDEMKFRATELVLDFYQQLAHISSSSITVEERDRRKRDAKSYFVDSKENTISVASCNHPQGPYPKYPIDTYLARIEDMDKLYHYKKVEISAEVHSVSTPRRTADNENNYTVTVRVVQKFRAIKKDNTGYVDITTKSIGVVILTNGVDIIDIKMENAAIIDIEC